MTRKKRIGTIVSNRPQKTIIVAVQVRYQHPKYAKILTKTKKIMAHDEENLGNIGDIVILEECAPYSKNKTWVLQKILKSYSN